MNLKQLQEEIEKEYISATVWGKDGFQIQLSNLLREAITKAYELGRTQTLENIKEELLANSPSLVEEK